MPKARRCIAQALSAALLHHPSSNLATALIQNYQSAPTDNAKERLLTCLERAQSAATLPVFAALLQDPQTPYAVEVLANRLLTAPPEEAQLLTGSLATVRSTDSGPELLRIAQGQRPEWQAASIRSAAIQALGNYPPGLTHATLERLTTDPEPVVAAAAQRVLARQKEPR